MAFPIEGKPKASGLVKSCVSSDALTPSLPFESVVIGHPQFFGGPWLQYWCNSTTSVHSRYGLRSLSRCEGMVYLQSEVEQTYLHSILMHLRFLTEQALLMKGLGLVYGRHAHVPPDQRRKQCRATEINALLLRSFLDLSRY